MAQTLGGVDAPEIPPYSSKSTVLPPILKGINFEQRLGSQIPLDATFQDENGKTVQLGSYFGKKPVVLILAYYRCPMLCTLVMDGAAKAFKQLSFDLGDQFDALTVSFDPRDTPKDSRNEQAKYVQVYGHPDAANSWHFLTGQKDQIQRLTDAVGFHYAYDPRTGQYVHTAGIVVITPAGKVAQYFYGVTFDPQFLRLALVQSSKDKIGSVVDQVLLYCCTYNPDTGRYEATIGRVLQIAGALTILLLGGGLYILHRATKNKDSGTQSA
ncbi:MAG TPA: SCO family protein [Candidatus Acidoferrales bacterium]|nr:SCO family protein [Candidatus Acidoferrales bacterium]